MVTKINVQKERELREAWGGGGGGGLTRKQTERKRKWDSVRDRKMERDVEWIFILYDTVNGSSFALPFYSFLP